jgi:hypothetical protein
MKIGPILGALSPGLSATGLFGHGAQQGGIGALTAMSPLLALLLHHKKHGGAPNSPPGTAPPPQAPGQMSPLTSNPGAPAGDSQDARQKALAQRLLAMGPQLAGGSQPFAIPFGPGNQNPYGYARY